ncbi:SGNH/GDSL hydrolase family protein [Congzhengia minquanensis]|uniref:SGNH/GDSL hydrolase family protein n=1 Tax=Congzhengia minquanensis TaxID=2763657 RepID=A0A926DMW6_9FIRM|nr:SGNH/GDSL hydrolase family protein [Congzhengia minquanensis]MBC8540624.1 SGNH/GDSL hydrolase family protein [Congzhengia minquanensis]
MNERYFAEKQDGVNTIHAEDFNLAFGDIADDMATLEAEAAASDAHIKNASNPHSVTKAQIGLGNVDNTKDADKPVSTATQAALDLKANAADVYYKNVLYTKNETDAKLALKANSADIYTKPEVDEKISSVSIWGGAVSSWEGLPTNPKPGTYCYVSSDIANGAKYSGKASDFFVIDSLPLGGDGIYICGLKTGFILDTACVGTNSGLDAVCVYNAARSKVGEIWPYDTGGNYPLNFSIELLGLSSADDTVTFYLGYWDGTSFPAKIENFSAGSMIFWNGTEWCGVASADLAGEVSGKADKIKTNPHGGIYGYPLIVTDHLAGEGPISLKVYGASDGVGDLVASGDYTGKYAIPITIRGKNLFSTKSIQNTSSTINGITWTINDDGSITANGTATANSHYNAVKQADAILFPAGDYSFSTTYEHYNQIQFKIITYVDGAATILTQTLGKDSPVFTLADDTYLCFQCTIGSGKTLDNVTIYPRIEYGKVLTEYEPYGISAEKTVYTDAPLTEGESVEITDIVMPESAKLFISANTTVPPSGMELLYYQDMNKLVGEFASGAHPLMGKKILCLGDSIFGTKNTEVSEFFKSITKANVYNCALGGTRMAQHEEGWDNWSMYRFAYSIANNDWAIQENGLSHTNVPPFAEERLAFIKTLDFNDIDVITINHGTNDWSGSITLDNDSNPLDTTTYMGALRYSIETILTAYPHLKIVVLSPCWRYWKDADGNFTNDSNTRTNTISETLLTYVNKGKQVAANYQLNWIDLYHIGFNELTTSIYFPSTDTTHPNNTGRLAIAKKMAECMGVTFAEDYTDSLNYADKTYVDNAIGDIETALDSIIAIQNELIGGDGE